RRALTTIQPFFQVVVKVLVDALVIKPNHGIVAVAAAGAFQGVANAAIVVSRAPSMAVAADSRALGNGTDHRGSAPSTQATLEVPRPAPATCKPSSWSMSLARGLSAPPWPGPVEQLLFGFAASRPAALEQVH